MINIHIPLINGEKYGENYLILTVYLQLWNEYNSSSTSRSKLQRLSTLTTLIQLPYMFETNETGLKLKITQQIIKMCIFTM